MSENGPTSPDDPAWVDDIVRRALARADAPQPGGSDAGQRATTAAAPTSAIREGRRETAAPTPPALDGLGHEPARYAMSEADDPLSEPGTPEADDPLFESGTPEADDPLFESGTPEADDPLFESGTPEADDPLFESGPPEAAVAADQGAMRHPTPPPSTETATSSEPEGSMAPVQSTAFPATESTPIASPDRPPYPDTDDRDLVTAAVDTDDDPPTEQHGSRMRGFLEWGAVVVGALAVALLIKTFLMQAYFIPSASMESTLDIGDRVLVNKLSYQFGEIGRGDLVVFNRPPNQTEGEDDLIKRVIALPGETIEIRDGEVFITPVGSDELRRLEEPYLTDGINTSGLVDTSNCVDGGTPTECTIPDGHVFVLGDNRPFSKDSRFFGPVDEDLVVGRAFLRVWPISELGFL